MARSLFWLSDEAWKTTASRQAGKTARGRSDCHFRHPACVENRMPLARRSASLWATDDHLQSLRSLVPAPYLAAHFRENGGRRRRQPAQMAQTKEGQSSRSIHSLTPDALSSGQQGLQTQKTHRTHVLQAQELATHRNPI